jgi:hypothetical protein
MMGSKRVDHWTSGTVYECSEIAGSPHGFLTPSLFQVDIMLGFNSQEGLMVTSLFKGRTEQKFYILNFRISLFIAKFTSVIGAKFF